MHIQSAVKLLTEDNAIACDEMKDKDSSDVLVRVCDNTIRCGKIYSYKSITLREIKEIAEGWCPTNDMMLSKTWTVIKYF